MDYLTDPAIRGLLVRLAIALLGLLGAIRLGRKPWKLH